MEGITQLRKSNFEQSKCKWRHQCHTFAKKGSFFLTCPPEKSQMLYLFISKVISNFCEIISQFLCCQCIVKFLKKFLSKQPQEVIFSRKTVKISHLSFTFNTVPVAHTTCQDEHLGLYLDKKLSFSDHINGKV